MLLSRETRDDIPRRPLLTPSWPLCLGPNSRWFLVSVSVNNESFKGSDISRQLGQAARARGRDA